MTQKLLLLFTVVLMSLGASAYDFMVGDLCYNKNSDGTSVTVTYQNTSKPRYTSLSGDIEIPSSVNDNGTTYSVTNIGDNAFANCPDLTSVTIPNSVVTISNYAFHFCTGLTSVVIPASVTTIGNYAFNSCESLPSIKISKSVTSIGVGAFNNCAAMTSVTWNAVNLNDCTSSPFTKCGNLVKFKFGNKVERIPAYLCQNMTSLTSLTIPESVTSIGRNAFSGCTGITKVTIPKSITFIGAKAFDGCTGLTSVEWYAKEVRDFDSSSWSPFVNCTNLATFKFDDNVIKIPAFLCYDLKGLTSVNLPDSLSYIGRYAFGICTSLTNVTIPHKVTSISDYAFSGCKALTDIFSLIQDPSKVTLGSSVFNNVPTTTCVLHVPKGTVSTYKGCNQWKSFINIKNIRSGDIDGNGVVDVSDVNLVIDMVLGKVEYNSAGDINEDGIVDVSDVNFLIDVVLGKAYISHVEDVVPYSTTADVICTFDNAPSDVTCYVKITDKTTNQNTYFKGVLGDVSQTVKVTGLKVNTTYQATAYIYDGGEYYYGKDTLEFTTGVPSAAVASVTDIRVNTATANCVLSGIDEGVEYGVKAKSSKKTLTINGDGGDQSLAMSGLTAWTDYQCYAYVKAGDYYTEQESSVSFTTYPNMSGTWTLSQLNSTSTLVFTKGGGVTITRVGDKSNGLYGTTVTGSWSAKDDGSISIYFSDAHQTSTSATYYSLSLSGALDNIYGPTKAEGKATQNWAGWSGTDHYTYGTFVMTRK